MKKFLNSKDDFLKKFARIWRCTSDIITCYYDPNFITRSEVTKGGK